MEKKYQIGQSVEIMYFGSPEKMIIKSQDPKDLQWKCVWPEGVGLGSCYYTESELDNMAKEVAKFRKKHRDLFPEDTDAMGNCYSDADPGL